MTFRTIGTVAVALLASGALFAQEGRYRLKSTEVVPGLYMLDSADDQFVGGNMGLLIGADGVILIDDGLEAVGPALLAAIADVTGEPVDFVINTHVHGDHVGSNAALHGQGATIVAHDNIRKRMAEATGDSASPREALPEITYADGVTFHMNGFTTRAHHVAKAHTDGDSIIHFPDVNVIHTGDVLFNGMFPFIDLASGGSVDGYLAAQNKLIALADGDTKIISGHGPLAKRSDVQRARDMLSDAHARVKRLADRGMSEDQVVAENPLSVYESWSWGFITTERMTRQLYQSLTQ